MPTRANLTCPWLSGNQTQPDVSFLSPVRPPPRHQCPGGAANQNPEKWRSWRPPAEQRRACAPPRAP
eukprot:5811562-Lingulodinium_polyedra.AAC.1